MLKCMIPSEVNDVPKTKDRNKQELDQMSAQNAC